MNDQRFFSFAQNDITTWLLFEYLITGGLVMRHVIHVMA